MTLQELARYGSKIIIRSGEQIYQGAEIEDLMSVSVDEAMKGMIDEVYIDGRIYEPFALTWVRVHKKVPAYFTERL
jgi:hypothetical protein